MAAMEQNKNYFQYAVEIFNKLSLQQRILIGGVALLTIVLLIMVIFFFNEPDYGVLYSNLTQEDAAKVVEQLDAQGITYKLEQEGSTVTVPQDKVYDTRLKLAASGIPSSGIVGYELFDNQTMGMSDFMQKLNYKRALEGELSKTIMQIMEVEAARVMIVVPQRAVFKDEQKEPTASVVLKLVKGVEGLSEESILAISNLLASSVEGLKPDKVTIVDTNGKMLSKDPSESELSVFTSKQYELKNSVENYLSSKAQSMLDPVLGYGNSVVRVDVELDFNQVDKTNESFDPETQIEISQQTVKTQNAGKNFSDTTTAASENTTTNYEVSKTVEHILQGPGNIKRITVAAVVNAKVTTVKTADKVEKVVEERSPQELEKIRQIISQSVGIDLTRNDQISVVNIPFETDNFGMEEETVAPKTFIDEWGNLILMILAVLVALFVLKNLLTRLKEEKVLVGQVQTAGGAMTSDLPQLSSAELEEGLRLESGTVESKPLLELGDIKAEISDEAIKRQVRQEKIAMYVQKNPTEAARLINLWLKDEE